MACRAGRRQRCSASSMKHRMRQHGSGITGRRRCSVHRRNGTGRQLRSIDETKIKVKGTWYFFWAAVDTENRAESCSAWKSRRREIVMTPPVSSDACSRRARTRRRCSWTAVRGIHGRSAGWACPGAGDVREAEYGGAVVFGL